MRCCGGVQHLGMSSEPALDSRSRCWRWLFRSCTALFKQSKALNACVEIRSAFPSTGLSVRTGFFYLLLREPVRSPVRFRAFVDTLEGFPARQGLFCSARAVVCECEILWVLCLCVRGGKSIICIGSGAASGSSAEKLKPNGGGTRTLRAAVKVGKILGWSCSCIVCSQRGQPRKIDRLRQN